MPNTRPGIKFVDDICNPCINYEKQKNTDWDSRKKELEKICDKYRNKNGNGYIVQQLCQVERIHIFKFII